MLNFLLMHMYILHTFQLLEGEVYHYHAKVILKEARTGGAHVWHQDYGYVTL